MRSFLICLFLLLGYSVFSQERKVHLVPIEIIEPKYNDTFDEDRNGTKRIGLFAFENKGPDSLLIGDKVNYSAKFATRTLIVKRPLAPGEIDTIRYTYVSTALIAETNELEFCVYFKTVRNSNNIDITKHKTAYIDPEKKLCINIIYYSIYSPRPENIISLDSTIINTTPPERHSRLFPNPATGYFFIRLADEEVNPQQVELIDATGKMRSLDFEMISDKLIKVDANQLANGLYILRLLTQDGVRIEKVQIE